MLTPRALGSTGTSRHPSRVCPSATMKLAADKPQKQVTFRITYPNSCSLKYDDLDLRLRDMLTASGIEPKEPTKTAVVEVGSAEA